MIHLSYYPQSEREQIMALFSRNSEWFIQDKLLNGALVYRVLRP